MLSKLISGGQTGVDRGALDAALEARFPCGGVCPKGRRAEDGIIPARYPLTELETGDYASCVERNVLDSDGTLIIYFGALSRANLQVLRFCGQHRKPALTVDGVACALDSAALDAEDFIDLQEIRTLHVAGTRESSHAGSARYAKALVGALLNMVRPASP